GGAVRSGGRSAGLRLRRCGGGQKAALIQPDNPPQQQGGQDGSHADAVERRVVHEAEQGADGHQGDVKAVFTMENTTWKTSEMVLTMPSVGVRTRSVLTHRKTPMAVT